MNYKISKELFEAVHGRKVDEHTDLRYKGFLSTLVVNDFFFDCKKWALKQGYNLVSYNKLCLITTSDIDIVDEYSYIGNGFRDGGYSENREVKAPSEQQAVFDACQWVLDKDKQ